MVCGGRRDCMCFSARRQSYDFLVEALSMLNHVQYLLLWADYQSLKYFSCQISEMIPEDSIRINGL